MTTADQIHMTRALELARSRLGRVAPNPAVGCVIVNNGVVVGEGATGDGGRPHAEEFALTAAAGGAADSTVYVTLEPCARRSSGDASCSQRLVDAGVARVIAASPDPHAFADGLGVARLRNAGVAVEVGLLGVDAERVNSGFLSVVRRGRPLVAIDPDAESYDADLDLSADQVSAHALKALAKIGLTRVRAIPGTPLAQALRAAGLVDIDCEAEKAAR